MDEIGRGGERKHKQQLDELRIEKGLIYDGTRKTAAKRIF